MAKGISRLGTREIGPKAEKQKRDKVSHFERLSLITTGVPEPPEKRVTSRGNKTKACAVPFCCPLRARKPVIALSTLMMRRLVLFSHCGVIISFNFQQPRSPNNSHYR